MTLCTEFSESLHGIGAIPAPVLDYARAALLDALGAALAGSTAPEVAKILAALDGSGEVSVWGSSRKLSAPQAALVNGTATHALEVDDFGGCGHSGAVVVPAALAAAERAGATGAELLAAIVTGYEAAARVTDLLGGYARHNASGWHGTGTAGAFGAAAAAARILRLDAGQMAHAIALAGTYAGGIWSFIPNGAMSKRLHAGKAAENGTAAAFLAQQDFTGPIHLFERGWGSFSDLYGAGGIELDALKPRDEFLIFRSGFKPYACCRGCHSPLDAALLLQREHGFTADDIAAITVRGSEQDARQLGKQRVENVLDAQMSLPYSMAIALAHGRADLKHYLDPYLGDPAVTRFAEKVEVRAETPGASLRAPLVEIHLRDGGTLSHRVEIGRGAVENPMTADELGDKFFCLATLRVPQAQAEAIAAAVRGIDTAESVLPLIRLLRLP